MHTALHAPGTKRSAWAPGVVTRYDADSGCYDVLYNDGEEGQGLVRACVRVSAPWARKLPVALAHFGHGHPCTCTASYRPRAGRAGIYGSAWLATRLPACLPACLPTCLPGVSPCSTGQPHDLAVLIRVIVFRNPFTSGGASSAHRRHPAARTRAKAA